MLDDNGMVPEWIEALFGFVALVEPTPIGEMLCCLFIGTMIGTAISQQNTSVGSLNWEISWFKDKTASKEKVESKTDAVAIPKTDPPKNKKTYYHVTTADNAKKIISTGILRGSVFESGYVYARKSYPTPYAIEYSGAHTGVIIAFESNDVFVRDPGVFDRRVLLSGPVVSIRSGPIAIENPRIVG